MGCQPAAIVLVRIVGPDFTLTKLFQEDGPTVVAPSVENPAAAAASDNNDNNDTGNSGARVARRVFLTMDTLDGLGPS